MKTIIVSFLLLASTGVHAQDSYKTITGHTVERCDRVSDRIFFYEKWKVCEFMDEIADPNNDSLWVRQSDYYTNPMPVVLALSKLGYRITMEYDIDSFKISIKSFNQVWIYKMKTTDNESIEVVWRGILMAIDDFNKN